MCFQEAGIWKIPLICLFCFIKTDIGTKAGYIATFQIHQQPEGISRGQQGGGGNRSGIVRFTPDASSNTNQHYL